MVPSNPSRKTTPFAPSFASGALTTTPLIPESMFSRPVQKHKSAYNRNLVWVYVVSESLGIGCMAMFAAFPSTIMEAAFGRLHNNGAGPTGTRPIVEESVMVDGKVVDIARQPLTSDSPTTYTHTKSRLYIYENIRTLCQRSSSLKNELIRQ